MMPPVMSTIIIVIVVTVIIVGAIIVVRPIVVIITGIVIVVVVIRSVIPRSTTKTETEALRLQIGLAYRQQSQYRQNKDKKSFHCCTFFIFRRNDHRPYSAEVRNAVSPRSFGISDKFLAFPVERRY